MKNYCYTCGQILITLYLPADKGLAYLQPAYYCMNRDCKMIGIVTTQKEAVDELTKITGDSEAKVNTSEAKSHPKKEHITPIRKNSEELSKKGGKV